MNELPEMGPRPDFESEPEESETALYLVSVDAIIGGGIVLRKGALVTAAQLKGLARPLLAKGALRPVEGHPWGQEVPQGFLS